MCESAIADAIEQLQAGAIDAPTDLMRIALSPASTLDQYHRITSALYAALDDPHSQMERAKEIFPDQQALCLYSLGPVVAQRFLRSGQYYRTVEPLLRHWDKLREWLLLLKAKHVDRESSDLSSRIQAKNCIVKFLTVCNEHVLLHMFDRVVSSPGIIHALFSLWRLEIQDPRFYVLEDHIPHTPNILNSWMSAFSRREIFYWPEILFPFGGDPGTLATAALDRLRHDVALTPVNYDLVGWDTHILTTFSVNDTICVSLLNQRSMSLLTSIISSMVNCCPTTNQHSAVARCISYGYWYIHAAVESTNGIPWVAQIVEAGILSAMLSTEPWLKYLDGPHSEDWDPVFLLLGDTIPMYSIYSSVLRPLMKQLAAIDKDGLPARVEKDGLLSRSWSVIDKVVRRRIALYKSAGSNGMYITSCQNAKCNKSGPLATFKSCTGCLRVDYCSRECQVDDWKNGGHKKPCRDIQACHADGVVSLLPKRELRFIDRVIADELRCVRDEIQHAATTLNFNPVFVELNYMEFPVDIEVGSFGPVPPMHARRCGGPMTHGKLYDVVELIRKSTSKKVLACALLPGGKSGKVKLQCFPLKRILEDSTQAVDEETRSDFDDTFDLLHSRAGPSHGTTGAHGRACGCAV